MASRRSSYGRNSRKDDDSEEEVNNAANEGYIQVFLKPLETGSYSVILGWLGIHLGSNSRNRRLSLSKITYQDIMEELRKMPAHVWITGSVIVLLTSLMIYQLIWTDFVFLFQRLCGIVQPIFSIACAFYWLAFYFRKSWNTTSIYTLLCSCFVGEFLGQCMCDSDRDFYITQPFLTFVILVTTSIASVFSSLETVHSVFVIGFVSFIRFLACTSLFDLPQSLRPFIAYSAGIMGIIGAKYMESTFKPPINNSVNQDGKIAIIKRRRSSSSAAHCFMPNRVGRRTSLPALIQKTQTSSSSYESAIIGEAHGLISDMLADSSLPPHVVSGLHVVSNLLKPPESHGPIHKPRVSPLVSLTETTNYGSDSEDLPYTGERPSSLPKRLRRSLPPSLIRRMSTSTWTTTTSATGLPTLEPEPCRTRSCSFRHSRDNTPGSSPSGSRSNSPSPSSPTALSLTIPKSRSFSSGSGVGVGSAPPGSLTNQKRGSRERRATFQGIECGSPGPARSGEKIVSPSPKGDDLSHHQSRDALGTGSASSGVCKRFNITSDYESSDSPSSSDHSDTIMSVEDISGPALSPPSPNSRHISDNSSAASTRLDPEKVLTKSPRGESAPLSSSPSSSHRASITVSAAAATPSSAASPSSSSHVVSSSSPVTAAIAATDPSVAASAPSPSNSASRWETTKIDNATSKSLCSEAGELVREVDSATAQYDAVPTDADHSTSVLPYGFEHVQQNKLLDSQKLNQWDYPIFDLAVDVSDCILSMVACKLFTEAGLFETFRIPIDEFIHYFHALELGYREKPYHNRIHATDVLHGVYYLTTQPIPGFQQISSDCDIFHHKSSSSESDTEAGERCGTRINFTAEDTYGIMGGNLPPLELMALYAAAAMHDYDHPGRTNAFLVTTNAPLAILYNDRSVLESHHAASAWRLYLSDPRNHWLVHLDKAEFKRFRFLVIEAILATDLKRHFELLAEFNAKVNDEDAPGIDWTSETDRLMASNMVIKMADINGPCKGKDLHFNWTNRISEEFYEQGDEEQSLGLPISPYMDRKHPQLAKLQESFINHLVAPLCNALGAAGLIPGTWIEGASDSDATDTDKGGESSSYKDTEDESTELTSASEKKKKFPRKMHCWLTQNLKDNHDMWVNVLKQEVAQKERETKQVEDKKETQHRGSLTEKEMEPITEEDTPPNSANNLAEETNKASDRPTHRQKRGSQSGSTSQTCTKETD